ncbi:MBL fold metallo-hydrolase [Thalassobacillus pellis]|uniref:MBL fold metallo-hydrolase n=1 Tax=Thalassobacillus pellis TaxID=748008 RepID=UPI001960E492|nr:MBL fold metallo-hydrolase [Thalassobacillus pellis]MBM7554409.1 7,8-dihydropterin-6-yl-methyl-4-(beta-D-ribofuranosyl)aminobenzene 5'-phosphate synthase [Thalassobacillus pellis]
MEVQATVLSENSVFGNLGAIAEHGWSVFLETDYGNYLFDTGQGKVLLNNARVFHKDLSRMKGIILSHHHMDHTGGLLDAVQASKKVPIDVYAHPALFKEGYLVRNGHKYIGVPYSRVALEGNGANFKFNTEFTEIAPNVYLTGEVPRVTDFEYGDTDIVLRTSEGYVQDAVIDDQSVIIKTQKGLFVILGCSHAGIINILHYAVQMTGESRIHTVIGGTHLAPVSKEQKEKSRNALKDLGIQHLGVSHCTGLKVGNQLSRDFGERFFYCNVGTVVNV